MAPIAAEGNTICGFGEAEGYPHLYIYDIDAAMAKDADLFAYGVCVEECPDSDTAELKCSPATPCNKGLAPYKTYDLFDYCAFTKEDLPTEAQSHWDDLMSSFQNSYSGSAFMDIYNSRWLIGCCPLIAVVFTFGYIYFMDKCAYWLSWFSVIIIELTLLGAGFGSLFYRKDLIDGMTD